MHVRWHIRAGLGLWPLVALEQGAILRAAKVEEAEDTGDQGGRRLLCAECGLHITSSGSCTQIIGSHVHTFANPHGIIYRIGCFLTAPGCLAHYRETMEFSWFAGYSWRIDVCGRCHGHLGWQFRGKVSTFHGLILDRLKEEERREGEA